MSYISREAAIDIASGYCHPANIADELRKLPSVQPERKKGKWIRWYEEIESGSCTDYIPHCKCSECGTDINARSSLFIKFCPYCGADMRGGA